VLEEARHSIAESLYKRWGEKRIPSESGGIEMNFLSDERMRGSEHFVFIFQAKENIRPETKSNLKPGTVVELMPAGQHSIKKIVLGNVVRCTQRKHIVHGNVVRCTQRDSRDADDSEEGLKVSIMIYSEYSKAKKKLKGGVRLVLFDSLLNLTRQFDACTTGYNDLNGEILGVREDILEVINDSHTELKELQNKALINEEEPLEQRSGPYTSESVQDPPQEPSANDNSNKSEVLKDELDGNALSAFGYHVPRLNPTQQKAAKTFLDSSKERISIIQGPPGTGKTTLLVSTICHFLMRAKQENKTKRLLVCAPTNKAVTVLAVRVLNAIRDDISTSIVLIGDQERLLADNRDLDQFFVYTWRSVMVKEWKLVASGFKAGSNVDKKELVLRAQKLLNSIKRQVSTLINDQVRTTMSQISASLLALSEAPHSGKSTTTLCDQITLLVDFLKKLDDRRIVQTLLAEATIIFCTLSSAGAQVMKETVAVDDIIVDEAAAATVPELCVGLWRVRNRLLLVGDPRQLPATVNSEYGKLNGLDKSLQDRLMNQCAFRYTMLDIQYRMKDEISRFPFKTFYSGNVGDGDNVLESSYRPDAAVLSNQPYAFVQVRGNENRDILGSCYNPGECDAVVGLLQDLKHRSGHLGNDWSNVNRIRVITFYSAQVNEIRKRLFRLGLRNVLISTVDSSQGCEADIVIISFVRGETIGFLSDYRRLNVALTRAKHQLVCVGDVRTLAMLTSEKASIISQLAKDAIERGCVVDNYSPRSFQGQPGNHRRLASKEIRNGKQTARPRHEGLRGPSQAARPASQPHNRQHCDTNLKKRKFALGTKRSGTGHINDGRKKGKVQERQV
jgi:superfamily I DNA and/or RNA helicase